MMPELKMTFNRAVEHLDDFLRTKTVHSVASIKEKMMKICHNVNWHSAEDHDDFANICSNFEKYCHLHKTTSFGRKQFEAAWEKGFVVEPTLDNALKMIEGIDLKEDPLPDVMQDIRKDFQNMESEEFTDIHKANAYIRALEIENVGLKKTVLMARGIILKVKGAIEPWD